MIKKQQKNKSVMHRGFSIQNCTLQVLCDRAPTFFLFFCIVCDSETDLKKVGEFICGSDSNVLKMFRVSF